MNSEQIAQTIRAQIKPGALFSLGAHNFMMLSEDASFLGGLQFTARIIPFTKHTLGPRGVKPRLMNVRVLLTAEDLYDIRVEYHDRGNHYTHYSAERVDFTQLESIILALDYDGEEVLNPRFQ